MQVLLDQVIHDMRNKGNVALLQAALERVGRLFPGAQLGVLTEAPQVLRHYCPQASPVRVNPPSPERNGLPLSLVGRVAPRFLIRWGLELREELKSRRSRREIGARGSGPSAKSHEQNLAEGEAEQALTAGVLQAVQQADLVLTTGGGYLCDYDKRPLTATLAVLRAAIQMGKPTAMLGQGVGPLDDPDLRRRLAEVLPKVDLILARERRVAPALLQALGVDAARVMMTGDDAIQMAYGQRSHSLGRHLGVGFRIAPYTQVTRDDMGRLRPILQAAARRHRARMIPLSISHHVREDDRIAESALFSGYQREPWFKPRFHMPVETIRLAGKCRVVVAGAYHSAVFALAQGIPAVGIVKSLEYRNKFQGLRDEFGCGCEIVSLESRDFEFDLGQAIDRLWQNAEELRPQLLKAAESQIELATEGYERLRAVVSGSRATIPSASAHAAETRPGACSSGRRQEISS